ncbi:GTP-binding protein [Phreatobacter sp.]|uniref:sulfate adenylyltransferase subunit 1 n=1 Tax=Phreatobacter sp. TaxID=1966341 RepID=UPI0022C529B5|nr:GTP-binding protein [Phreatobacter sp.]MCZ8314927.1 GTP-binding protein [Phreatobacter sp.]
MGALAAETAAPLPAAANDAAPASRSLLRFITCGSVDDGKSTLLGRLLYEAGAIPDDVIATLEADSARIGRADRGLDYSLLLDGLQAEREQGITIDVAYRYFSTARRAFIVADTPGHEQYTRNMATGASTADLAIILIDAGKGVLPQTRRHALIAAFVGVRHLVVAINKIDLVDCDAGRIRAIETAFRSAITGLAFDSVTVIPLSARDGDNLAALSPRTPWYDGPTLLGWLEAVGVDGAAGGRGFIMPVQWVNRPDAAFRGFAGTIAAGSLAVGDSVDILPSRQTARVTRIVTFDGDLQRAGAGTAVTLVLDREIDVSRGDVIVAAGTAQRAVRVRTSLDAKVLVTGQAALVPGATYLLRLGTASANATVERVVHGIDIATYEERDRASVETNELAVVRLRFDRPLAVASYAVSQGLGAFILIDKVTHETAAMGTVLGEAASAHRPRLQLVGQSFEQAMVRTYGGDWRRNLVPATTWRLGSALLLGVVVGVLTGHPGYAAAAAAADALVRPLLRHLHRGLWSRWSARREAPLAENGGGI